MNIILFPYSMVRYAGLEHASFHPWKLQQHSAYLEKYLSLQSLITSAREVLCNEIYLAISKETDDSTRQQLINLKRQVYNGKHWASLKTIWEKTLYKNDHGLFDQYQNLLTMYEGFISSAAEQYMLELAAQRKYLQQQAADPILQQALLLSSPVLFQQLKGFIHSKPENFRQKELRIEFSLLRYLTRMGFKTSPFSTFTHTGIMQAGKSATDHPVPHNIQSKMQLNNALFTYLLSIIRHHPQINEILFIKLNSTALIKDDKIHFLVNYNNVESFQTLPARGIQLLVIQILSNQQQTFTFKKLTAAIRLSVTATDDLIKSYLMQLIATGLLDLDAGIAGIDPKWDERLIAFLENSVTDIPSLPPLVQLFKTLSAYRDSYPSASNEEKFLLLDNAAQQINTVFGQLQSAAGLPDRSLSNPASIQEENTGFTLDQFTSYQFQPRQIFYENCYTPAKEIIAEEPLSVFISQVDQLISSIQPLDTMQAERKKMKDFFIRQYEIDAAIPLISFYKDYYSLYKKREKELKITADQQASAISIDNAALSDQWILKLRQQLSAMITGIGDEICLTTSLFDFHKNKNTVHHQYSRGIFVQLFHGHTVNKELISGVINSILPGMGKVSGRFLPLFEDEMTREQVNFNNRLYDQHLKVELHDASTFNANIHPPLLSNELSLPGGNYSYPKEQQIQIKEVTVKINRGSSALQLHYHGKILQAFDLSLESLYFRSNFYQLLAHFNLETKAGLQAFIEIIDSCYLQKYPAQETEITCLPRITYQKNVILRRQHWRIKTSGIPSPKPDEPALVYYLRLNEWRIQHQLPEHLFIFLRRKSVLNTDPNDKAGLGDDYKPQYFSFEQPLMIEMLKKLVQRAGKYLFFEEVLPDPGKHQLPYNSQRVKEYLIQWYNFSDK